MGNGVNGEVTTPHVTRPLSLAFIITTVLILVVMVVPAVRERRKEMAD